MTHLIHRIAAFTAFLCIATFFLATLIVETFATLETVTHLKSLIVWPGLFILVPAIAITGASGFLLAQSRKGKLVQLKQKRMPFIGINGVFILIPCAIFLDRWASIGNFDNTFYTVQGIELIAGAINLTLMMMNIRDGFKMSGRFRSSR